MKYYYQIEGDLRNNIGDVLQGMVAKAFLPEDAQVVDREALSDMDKSEAGFLIANGWYMHSFDKFPPPPNINPLYISVHVAQSSLLASPKVREHFKKNAPIGCRDDKTLKLFLGWGIPAYNSSCLTITSKARAGINNTGKGEVLLVDNVDHPIPPDIKAKLEKLLDTSLIRVSHDPPDVTGNIEKYADVSEKHMNKLLKRYCEAALVVTTKIHCALPCLGMGANVMLIHPDPSDPRLATVAEFMEIISYSDIRAADKIVKPVIKKEILINRKDFLSKIVSTSLSSGGNIISSPNSIQYKAIKYKSILMAKAYRLGVQTFLKLGIANDQMKKVYLSDRYL
jgi:hypothetical protein